MTLGERCELASCKISRMDFRVETSRPAVKTCQQIERAACNQFHELKPSSSNTNSGLTPSCPTNVFTIRAFLVWPLLNAIIGRSNNRFKSNFSISHSRRTSWFLTSEPSTPSVGFSGRFSSALLIFSTNSGKRVSRNVLLSSSQTAPYRAE